MKKYLLLPLSAGLFTLLLWSCNKRDEQTQSTYTFTNTTRQRITFDIYNSKEDYNHNAARLQQYIIEPGASQPIALDIAHTYWVDWYNASYSLNNWRSLVDNVTSPLPEIRVAAEDDHLVIATTAVDTSRSMLLNGSGLSSKWHGATVSITSTDEETFRFEFRKDFSGEYSFTDARGTTTIKSITYAVQNSYSPNPSVQASTFILSVYDEQPDRFCQIYASPGGANTTYNLGRDTMLISFPRSPFTQFGPLVRD